MVLPVLAGTTVLHNLQTTLVWLRSDLYYPKNCHTGELTFLLLFTISSFAAALIFCLWKGIQQTSTRQRYGATKHDTVTWLAGSVSLPTLLGYQRASAFVNATKLASQPLFSSDEEYKISNVLSNTFFIDIDHVSIAIHIVIVLSPSPTQTDHSVLLSTWEKEKNEHRVRCRNTHTLTDVFISISHSCLHVLHMPCKQQQKYPNLHTHWKLKMW